MTQRSLRFTIERPVEYRFTDVRGGSRLRGRTINISSGGVLLRTDQRIGVGRKLEITVRMAQLMPGGPEVDLRLLGIAVRSGDGWVAVQAHKQQILKGLSGTLPGSDSIPGRIQDPAA